MAANPQDSGAILHESRTFEVGEWHVEPALNRIGKDGESVRIDPQQMKLLQLLASRPGAVWTQLQIEQFVWPQVIVTPNSVYQGVAQLRRALGDDSQPRRYIETIPRKGYRLVAKVTYVEDGRSHEATERASAPRPSDARPSRSAPAADLSSTHVTTQEPVALSLARTTRVAVLASFIAVPAVVLAYGAFQHVSASSAARQPLDPTLLDTLPLRAESPDAPKLGDFSRAKMLQVLAQEAVRQGYHQVAIENLQQAIAARRKVLGDRTDPMLGDALAHLAKAYLWGSDYSNAEAAAREAVEILESGGQLSESRVHANLTLGDLLTELQRYDEAERILSHAARLAAEMKRDGGVLIWSIDNSLTELRSGQGRHEEALQLARKALKAYTDVRGWEEVDGAYFWTIVVREAYLAGRYDEAASQGEALHSTLERIVRPNHPYLASAKHYLALSLTRLGRLERAEHLLHQEMQAWKVSNAPQWRIARSAAALGENLLRQGRLREAESHLVGALAVLEASAGVFQQEARVAAQRDLRELQLMRLKARR